MAETRQARERREAIIAKGKAPRSAMKGERPVDESAGARPAPSGGWPTPYRCSCCQRPIKSNESTWQFRAPSGAILDRVCNNCASELPRWRATA